MHRVVPSVGPAIFAYRNTSSTTIYVQWNHTIPEEKYNGILVGYQVSWDDTHFSSGQTYDSRGHRDVGLDVSSYTITSLHEYWLYEISVAGRTSVGPGTRTMVTLMTDDDGKSFTKLSERFLSRRNLSENFILGNPLN